MAFIHDRRMKTARIRASQSAAMSKKALNGSIQGLKGNRRQTSSSGDTPPRMCTKRRQRTETPARMITSSVRKNARAVTHPQIFRAVTGILGRRMTCAITSDAPNTAIVVTTALKVVVKSSNRPLVSHQGVWLNSIRVVATATTVELSATSAPTVANATSRYSNTRMGVGNA